MLAYSNKWWQTEKRQSHGSEGQKNNNEGHCINTWNQWRFGSFSCSWQSSIPRSTKFVHGGFWRNWQKSTSTIMWASTFIGWSGTTVKATVFWTVSSLVIRLGCTIMKHKANVTSMQWKHPPSSTAKNSSQDVSADGVLGHSGSSVWTLPGMWYHSNKCNVLWQVVKWSEASHSHKTTRKIIGSWPLLAEQCLTSYCFPY